MGRGTFFVLLPFLDFFCFIVFVVYNKERILVSYREEEGDLTAVIFDLELMKRFKKGQLSEIVEIGACKVDLENKQIIDQIQIYVKPKSGYISKTTRKFINMAKEDMKKAIPFPDAIRLFSNWLGSDYFLCSWGKDDKHHIINQCARSRISLDWFINYNDIQKPIGKFISTENQNQIGLKNALDLTDIEVSGKAHRGIDDAINTAQLFLKFIDQITLQKNSVSKNEIELHLKKVKQMKLVQQQMKNNRDTPIKKEQPNKD